MNPYIEQAKSMVSLRASLSLSRRGSGFLLLISFPHTSSNFSCWYTDEQEPREGIRPLSDLAIQLDAISQAGHPQADELQLWYLQNGNPYGDAS